MIFVDTRNIDRVDFHNHVPLHCFFDSFHLLGEEKFCAFDPGIALALVIDELVDFCTDLRVNGVKGYRYISHIVFLEEVDLFRQQ